jgi:hypothetical protein
MSGSCAGLAVVSGGVSGPTQVRDRPSPLDVLLPSATRVPVPGIAPTARSGVVGREARAQEQFRQEREAFEENLRQVQSWSRLRLSMGWTALVLQVVLCATSIFVVISHANFPTGAITAAVGTVFAQTLAFVAAVWRLVLGAGPQPLTPLTRERDER